MSDPGMHKYTRNVLILLGSFGLIVIGYTIYVSFTGKG